MKRKSSSSGLLCTHFVLHFSSKLLNLCRMVFLLKKNLKCFCNKINPGGLDSRDQSRSRSRTSIVSRLTFENRQDYPSCRDQLFFILVKIFKIEIFQSRLCLVEIFVEIVETCRDCRDLSRRVEIFEICRDAVEAFWVWKWWKVSTDWEISMRKYKNPRTSRSRSRQTVEKCQNFQISTKFSISIEIFWSERWCRDEIEIFRSWSLRLTFWRCQDFLDCRDSLFDDVETNWDPQG